MKRKLIIFVIVIALLTGFGALLHSPPSLVDAITGATPKSKKTETVKLEGTYVIGFNTQVDGLDNEICNYIEKIIRGDISETTENIEFRLYVPVNDSALKKYAEKVCRRLIEYGVSVTISEYSNVMLRSRVVSGKYEAFIASKDTVNVDSLQNVEFFIIDSSEME